MSGYVARAEFLIYAAPAGGANLADDEVIDTLLERVSAYVDLATGRTFAAVTGTRYFDVPRGRMLYLDADLCSLTKVTNGNGVIIAAANYRVRPINEPPYYGICLRETSSVGWEMDASGNSEGVIAVTGLWGYSVTPPEDIRQAVMMIASNLYKGRSGETATGAATVTGAGVVITPKDVPTLAQAILTSYRRIV